MLIGAIVPHAPLLVVGANSDGIPAARAAISTALTPIRSIACDLVIVVSPHAPVECVYREPAGDLAGFGVRDLSASAEASDRAAALASAWGFPLEDRADHGITVPLLLGGLPPVPTIACGLGEWTGASGGDPCAALVAGSRLATAIEAVTDDLTALVVCSAHGPAGLTSRAPLTERAESKVLERRILDALAVDPGNLVGIEASEWSAGGACGAAPLVLFGHLFSGRPCELLAYEAPVGVGYIVARTR